MTVATTTAQNIKNGNGSTTLFPLDFIFFVDADLKVTHILADGTLVPKTLTTDYSVAGGDGATGSITTTSFTAANGTQIVIERKLPFTQTKDYIQNDIFPAENTEQGLDRNVLLAQQVLVRARRTVTLPLNTVDLDTNEYIMPLPEDDKIPVGDTTGKKWTNKAVGDISSTIITIPVAISQGGTGAITAALARVELGSTTVGDAVFIASNATAARSAMSAELADTDILKADTADTLTAGFNATEKDAGTKTSGTFTPNPADGNFQKAVNGGAHTLAPPGSTCSIVIQYTNNANAGAITTSGFTVVDGNVISTVDGDDFLFFVTRVNSFSHLHVKALQ